MRAPRISSCPSAGRRALLLALVALPLAAQAEPDPLWLKFLAHLDAVKTVAADESEVRFDVQRSGPESRSEHTVTRYRLDRWDGDKPVYVVTAAEPPLETNDARARQAEQLDQLNSGRKASTEWLRPDTPVRRSDEQAFGSKLLTRFEAEDKGLGRASQLQAWVDPLSGRPERIEVRGRFVFVLNLQIATDYQTDELGRSLPSQISGQLNIDAMGRGLRMDFGVSVQSWASRPASPRASTQ
ncbi:hypothetical protein RQP53_03985 [Paucibacter sp. APW11]|uniref:MucB/RseB N-terminal domain-containing protein n=1 Tax=Roseateles aquae TaxID=3077235 RepID=A0ABU3P786_9BURK|nr:hypothetical protein [Paucibacter sp. APW11]MDT8998432.1 hypothetical protein [Paucibacter sp. APW11]